jgi:ankyrin repeat protein
MLYMLKNNPQQSLNQKFFNACRDNNFRQVKLLLTDESLDVNALFHVDIVDKEGISQKTRSPLMIACVLGHIEIIDALLQHGRININLPNAGGATAFYLACQEGQVEVVKKLLADSRVDINKATCDEWTPFHAASGNGHTEIVKILLADQKIAPNKQASFGNTALHWACIDGDAEIVKILLGDKRIEVNLKNENGRIALHSACYEGRTEVIKILLADERIDANQKDNYGATAFYLALHNEYRNIIQLFLQKLLIENPALAKESHLQIATTLSHHFFEPHPCIDFFNEEDQVFIGIHGENKILLSDMIEKEQKKLLAAQIFYFAVFLSDDYFTLNNLSQEKNHYLRFFKIMKRLPQELQMLLCNRLVDSSKNFIGTNYFEAICRNEVKMSADNFYYKVKELLYYDVMTISEKEPDLEEIIELAKSYAESPLLHKYRPLIRKQDEKEANTVYKVLSQVNVKSQNSIENAKERIGLN